MPLKNITIAGRLPSDAGFDSSKPTTKLRKIFYICKQKCMNSDFFLNIFAFMQKKSYLCKLLFLSYD